MGRLGKEGIDQIRALLGAGYSKTEVSKEMGIDRKTVAKYADDTGPSLVQVDSGKVSLSLGDDVIKVLYDMMGVMGAPSILGAVKQAYLDTVALTKLKVTHWPVYSGGDEGFTAEAMIQHLLNFIDYQEDESKDNIKALRDADAEIERLKEFAEERFRDGYTKASQDHSIYVNCVYCGKPCLVKPRTQAHRFISEILSENDWGHTSCANQAQYDSERGTRELEAALKY